MMTKEEKRKSLQQAPKKDSGSQDFITQNINSQVTNLALFATYEENIRNRALVQIENPIMKSMLDHAPIFKEKHAFFVLHDIAEIRLQGLRSALTPIGKSLLPDTVNMFAYPDVVELVAKDKYQEAMLLFRDKVIKDLHVSDPILDKLKYGWWALGVTSAALTAYQIAQSDDKATECLHQGVLLSSGVAGSIGIGSLAIGPCALLGPAAPFCVAGAQIIGGIVGTAVGERVWNISQAIHAEKNGSVLSEDQAGVFNQPYLRFPNYYQNISIKEERVKQVKNFHVSDKSTTNANGDLIGMVFYDHKLKPELNLNGTTIKEGYIVFCDPASLTDQNKTNHRQLFERVMGASIALENVTVGGFSRQNGVWKSKSFTLNYNAKNTSGNYTRLGDEGTHSHIHMSDYEFNAVVKAAESFLQNQNPYQTDRTGAEPFGTRSITGYLGRGAIAEPMATPQSLRFPSFKEEMKKEMPKTTREEGLARLAAIEARMNADLFAKPSQRSQITSTFISTLLGSLAASQVKRHNLLNNAPSHYLPAPPIQTLALPKMDCSLVQDRQKPLALVFPKPPVESGLSGLSKEPKITVPSQDFFHPLPAKPQLQAADLPGPTTAWNSLMRPQSFGSDRASMAMSKLSLPSLKPPLTLPGASAPLLQEPKPLAALPSVSSVSLFTHKPALQSQAPTDAWGKMQASGRFRTKGPFE